MEPFQTKINIFEPKISDPGPRILILVRKNIRSWYQGYTGEKYVQEFGARIFDMSSASGYMGEKYFQEFGPRFLGAYPLAHTPLREVSKERGSCTWPYVVACCGDHRNWISELISPWCLCPQDMTLGTKLTQAQPEDFGKWLQAIPRIKFGCGDA